MEAEHVVIASEEKLYYTGKEAIGRKLAFGSGEIVYNFPWMLVSSFLMFFLTDIALVPAAVVAALFLGVRIWDAVNDPVIGLLADRTRSKHGRYRPWMFWGGIFMMPLVILLFWAHPEWSEAGRIWYACILYFLAVVAATMWNIPYGGLHASITPYPNERASFASYRILISSAACAIASGVFLPLTNAFGAAEGNVVNGFLMATVVICAIATPFIFTTFFGTKEVVHPPKNQKIKLSALVKVIGKNPPLVVVIIAFFVFGFVAYGRMTVAMYYFTYNWGDPGLFSLFTLVNGIITGITAFFGARILRVMKSKKNVVITGHLGMMVFSFILFFLSPENSAPGLVLALLYLSGAFNGLAVCMLYAMVPDTVEYGQWKSGIRTDGFVYAGTSFMLKLGGAIAPMLLGVLMAATGYLPGVAQNAPTLNLLNSMMNLMPALLSLLAVIVFLFYKLDNKLHARIVAEIEARGDHLME